MLAATDRVVEIFSVLYKLREIIVVSVWHVYGLESSHQHIVACLQTILQWQYGIMRTLFIILLALFLEQELRTL